MELGYSSVLCSVDGCNVSPERGRFCKEHKPRFTNNELLPPVDRVLVVLERNPELNDAGIQWIAQVNKTTIQVAKSIYWSKIRRSKKERRVV